MSLSEEVTGGEGFIAALFEAQGLTETDLAEVGGAVGGGVCETQGGLSEPKVVEVIRT